MRAIFLLFAVFAATCSFSFERIDGTFYLDRHTITWVVIMRNDKTYEVFGPDGMYSSGRYRSTDDHLTFLEGDQKRRFNYDWKDGSLKLGYKEGENILANGTLSRMPPSRESQNREHYVSEAEWRAKGRPLFGRPAPGVLRELPPVAQAPVQVQPPPPANVQQEAPAAAQNMEAVGGSYYLPGPNNSRELLAIDWDGRFEYTGLDGARTTGTATVVGTQVILATQTHQRSFIFRRVAGGIEFTRKESDVVKAGDALGKLPPQDREPFTWLTVPARQPDAEAPPPVGNPVNAAPAPVQPAQPAAGPAGNLEFAKILGTYVHKPNPFISETIVISGDGKFSYKDSNGAGAQGVFSVVEGILTVTSGEVVRKFSGSSDGKTLTLNCAPDDAPKFKNDMASMSPTVLKTAKYERQ